MLTTLPFGPTPITLHGASQVPGAGVPPPMSVLLLKFVRKIP
jgi:hypothetical protein